jgi:hypothetical protein
MHLAPAETHYSSAPIVLMQGLFGALPSANARLPLCTLLLDVLLLDIYYA